MACPHVSGTAALLHSLGITNPVDIRSLLRRQTAVRHEPVDRYGAGILDAAAAARTAARKNQLNSWEYQVGIGLAGAAIIWFLIRVGRGGLLASYLPEALGLGLGFVLPDYLFEGVWSDVVCQSRLPECCRSSFGGAGARRSRCSPDSSPRLPSEQACTWSLLTKPRLGFYPCWTPSGTNIGSWPTPCSLCLF